MLIFSETTCFEVLWDMPKLKTIKITPVSSSEDQFRILSELEQHMGSGPSVLADLPREGYDYDAFVQVAGDLFSEELFDQNKVSTKFYGK